MWSASPADGPGSWGFEGPEVMNMGARSSAMSFRKSAVKCAGRSSIGGAGVISIRGAGVISIRGAGMFSIVECENTGASSVVGERELTDVVSKNSVSKRK